MRKVSDAKNAMQADIKRSRAKESALSAREDGTVLEGNTAARCAPLVATLKRR